VLRPRERGDATIDTLAEALTLLSLVNIYGATETTAPVVVMPASEMRARLSQVGRPLPSCDVRIMDDAGREAAAGETGEIWVAGPMVAPGYWNNVQASASEFVSGYWRSGDIGTMDAQGYLSLSDRKKDMINRGGFKIYSVEVQTRRCATMR
jgi:acyl-CoA synthetase (AMP-forming)/AMP-acid ligase II